MFLHFAGTTSLCLLNSSVQQRLSVCVSKRFFVRVTKGIQIKSAFLALLAATFFQFNSQVLAADIPSEQASQLPPLAPAIDSNNPSAQNPVPSGTADANTAATNAADANNAQFAGDLSALENKLYSHDFSDEPVEKRLDRIERLVYGAAKTGTVQDRITQLLLSVPLNPDSSTTAQSTAQPVQPDTEVPVSEPAIKGPSPHWSLQTDVSAMEKEVFGKTYNSDSLTNRVSRLETAVFAGQPAQTFVPIRMRINKLWTALQPQFSAPKNYYAGKPITSTYNDSRKQEEEKKKGHPFWHKVGTVLGDVGKVAAEGAASMAASSIMMGGYGYGGYGPYGYGSGFGYPGGYW